MKSLALTNANATLSQMVSQINAVANTSVVASSIPSKNIVNSDSSNAIYGLVGGYTLIHFGLFRYGTI